MVNQQMGNPQQPLSNLVVEEFERADGIREIYFTIAMQSIPATAPIARGVADYASSEQRIGKLYVEKRDSPLSSFPIPFEQYLEEVSKLGRGEIDKTYNLGIEMPYNLGKSVLNLYCNLYCVAKNRGNETNNLYYILIPSNKISEMRSNGLLGYLFTSKDDELMREVREKIIGLVRENYDQSGLLTRFDYAINGDILEKIEKNYQQKKQIVHGFPLKINPISLN